MDRVYVMELVKSFETGGMSRRRFLRQATLALGSAAAAGTLLAACTTVATNAPPTIVPAAAGDDGDDIDGEIVEGSGATGMMVEYAGPGGQTLSGYLATPPDTRAAPGVVLIQEWWGLNDHIKDVARRLAAEGFVVLAPDLYHGIVVSEPDDAQKLVMELDMADAVAEIQSGVDHLQSLDAVSSPKVAVVGFCMGGRLALQTALVEDDLGAVVPFYGTPLTAAQAVTVKAPVLGHYGEMDGGISVADVEAMGAAFEDAGVVHEIHVYPGSQHAFFNDTRASYNAEAAAVAWQRTLDWLRAHVG